MRDVALPTHTAGGSVQRNVLAVLLQPSRAIMSDQSFGAQGTGSDKPREVSAGESDNKIEDEKMIRKIDDQKIEDENARRRGRAAEIASDAQ